MSKYWNEAKECMSKEEKDLLQLERLQDSLSRAYHNVPHYRRVFQKYGIDPEDVQSLSDLAKLPFTYKTDLRDNYPYDMFAVSLSEVVRIHSSSGTTGKPTVVGYTRRDLNTWSELMARSLTSGGANRHDVIQNAYGYGLFTGGLGFHYGGEKIGASIIPISGGNTDRQVMIMKDYGSTVLTCTPSYALFLAESLEDMGIKPEELKLKVGIFGAEPWSENMRREIESRLKIKALDIYGLSEIIGPGVAVECLEQKGLHVMEDHFIVEVIDPVTGEVLPDGEKGELVFTSLTKEALPIIRYRTGDISHIIPEPCACGRTLRRIGRIQGRTDDMLIIRGVNVFPSQIEHVLLQMGDVQPHYQLIVDRVGQLDQLEVHVEVSETFLFDEVRALEETASNIRSRIESLLGISVKVRLVEPKTLPRSEGKAKRVIDNRKL
ncbi:phenylacetate--CoA ligase family protein [Acidaminobacter hydrogenoformans]|uniref:Phenylacetate-coenzyme A ligase n=1 Tax=Acidaminobacter hydrogenoformans DSM 2784 TaxID=1120920 RepID=A0A1G5RTL1_9FIRM|nr:phenylacetate--CoA ligase [Acidaminobacter hydrogenoformans]SCZ77337.1 phenylacetate-CoA ligase [Acidaminobacter hydrogenoformans DSM 2784]